MDRRQIRPTAPEPIPERPTIAAGNKPRRAPIWKPLGYIQYRRTRRYVIQSQRGDIWELRAEELSTGKLLELYQDVEYWKAIHPRLNTRHNITTRIDARRACADIIRECLAMGIYTRPDTQNPTEYPPEPPFNG
jgi:hypothetical protein